MWASLGQPNSAEQIARTITLPHLQAKALAEVAGALAAASSTSLGLIIPVLTDAGQTESKTGLPVIAASSVAEFGSVLLLSLLFSTSGGSISDRLVSLAVFAALVAAVGVAVTLADRSMRLGGVFLRLQDTTAELRVRGAVALLIGFVALAQRIGLEIILGAFVAGVIVAAIDRDTTTHPRFRAKLDASDRLQPIRSAITVAGIRGYSASSARIWGSTVSTMDPVGLRSYFGGRSAASARATVLRAMPSCRAIAAFDRPSEWCSRRISAQSSMLITPQAVDGVLNFRPSITAQSSADADNWLGNHSLAIATW